MFPERTILSEIGRGAVGRTFLGSQRTLASRLMVLKVTPLGAEEHLRLARLQHMNIVPLYVEHVFPEDLHATLEEFRAELWSAAFDARRLALE